MSDSQTENPNADRYRRFNELSWAILGYKAAYYHPELLSPKGLAKLTITDAEYDLLEEEYRALGAILQRPLTAVDMVGFDQNRPSCRLVLSVHGKNDKK